MKFSAVTETKLPSNIFTVKLAVSKNTYVNIDDAAFRDGFFGQSFKRGVWMINKLCQVLHQVVKLDDGS